MDMTTGMHNMQDDADSHMDSMTGHMNHMTDDRVTHHMHDHDMKGTTGHDHDGMNHDGMNHENMGHGSMVVSLAVFTSLSLNAVWVLLSPIVSSWEWAAAKRKPCLGCISKLEGSKVLDLHTWRGKLVRGYRLQCQSLILIQR